PDGTRNGGRPRRPGLATIPASSRKSYSVNQRRRARKRASLLRAPGARRKRSSLNGSAPDTSSVALLLVDVINEFAFPEAPALLQRALPMARALQRLKQRAKSAGVPVVYVNDNF